MSGAEETARLQAELEALQAQLRVKDEYIAWLERERPKLERALQHLLDQERRRARRRELVRTMPVIGNVARWAARQRRHRAG